MPRLLAIEWDAREARVAVARTRGKEAEFEYAFAVELAAKEENSAETNVGERLATELGRLGLSGLETLVAVGRANIELRVLTVPPVPSEDLPDVVRFQALKQFTALGDDWPLDFVPLETQADGSQNVLAAAISKDLVGQIRHTCSAASLEPRRLVLRPFAAAALWRRRDGDPRGCLMVDFLADEADLTVLVDGHVAFMRTVRLSSHSDTDEQARAILGEIRRTIAAASNQLGGRRVERIALCGDTAEQSALKSLIEQQLSLEVVSFSPFDGLTITPELQSRLPKHSGRFAPLLGILVDEAAGTSHAIDFLHPRRRPVAPSRKRQFAFIGGATAAIVAALIAFGYWSYVELGDEIEVLTARGLELDVELKKFETPQRHVTKIDEFTAGDVTWIDELAEISERFLPADQAIANQLTMGEHGQEGGQASVEGFVRSSPQIDLLERKLRSDRYRVSGSGGQFDDKQELYRWKFKETISVAKQDELPPQREPVPVTKKNAEAVSAEPSTSTDASATKPEADKKPEPDSSSAPPDSAAPDSKPTDSKPTEPNPTESKPAEPPAAASPEKATSETPADAKTSAGGAP